MLQYSSNMARKLQEELKEKLYQPNTSKCLSVYVLL